ILCRRVVYVSYESIRVLLFGNSVQTLNKLLHLESASPPNHRSGDFIAHRITEYGRVASTTTNPPCYLPLNFFRPPGFIDERHVFPPVEPHHYPKSVLLLARDPGPPDFKGVMETPVHEQSFILQQWLAPFSPSTL